MNTSWVIIFGRSSKGKSLCQLFPKLCLDPEPNIKLSHVKKQKLKTPVTGMQRPRKQPSPLNPQVLPPSTQQNLKASRVMSESIWAPQMYMYTRMMRRT